MAAGKLTTQMGVYLATLHDFIENGRPVSVRTVSAEAKVDPRSVSRWRRDPTFLRLQWSITRSQNHADVELAHKANLRQAMLGNPRAYELLLRRLGLYDAMWPGDLPQPAGTPAAPNSPINNGVQVGSVTFIGVPIPPTRAQVEADAPPPGSNVIIPAPMLPPMPVRPPKGDK